MNGITACMRGIATMKIKIQTITLPFCVPVVYHYLIILKPMSMKFCEKLDVLKNQQSIDPT